MKEPLDTDGTDHVTCPHCGHVEPDLDLDIPGPGARILCVECDRPFQAERHIRVTFTTSKLKRRPEMQP